MAQVTSLHSQVLSAPDAPDAPAGPSEAEAQPRGVGCKAVCHRGPRGPAQQAEGASFQVTDPTRPMQSRGLPSLGPARADALQPPRPSPGEDLLWEPLLVFYRRETQ